MPNNIIDDSKLDPTARLNESVTEVGSETEFEETVNYMEECNDVNDHGKALSSETQNFDYISDNEESPILFVNKKVEENKNRQLSIEDSDATFLMTDALISSPPLASPDQTSQVGNEIEISNEKKDLNNGGQSYINCTETNKLLNYNITTETYSEETEFTPPIEVFQSPIVEIHLDNETQNEFQVYNNSQETFQAFDEMDISLSQMINSQQLYNNKDRFKSSNPKPIANINEPQNLEIIIQWARLDGNDPVWPVRYVIITTK